MKEVGHRGYGFKVNLVKSRGGVEYDVKMLACGNFDLNTLQ